MDNSLNIKIPKGKKLFVIGDVHEHEEQLDKAITYFRSRDDLIFVSVGDLLEKGFSCKKSIVNKVRDIVNSKCGFMVKGNHEINVINRLRNSGKPLNSYMLWLSRQPLSLSFKFYNGTSVTIVHGGIRPYHLLDDLQTNIEVCFCRLLDENNKIIKLKKKIENGRKISIPAKPNGVVWHKRYDGRFGYIISGHNSQKDGLPKFYNYSCNIDTACYHTGKLTAIIYNEMGREDLLTFEGTPRFPNLDQMYIDMAKGLV